MDFARKLSFLVFLLCVLISLKNQNAETKKGSPSSSDEEEEDFISSSSSTHRMVQESNVEATLRYDYYNKSCPFAEQIIRRTVHHLHKKRQDVAPALLRLLFHDCFIEGCDASVLLDPAEGINSEKDSPPNESLKGFDLIDTIKSELEEACPGVVSCADILVLAARESVILAGGPFYPLYTGRRDSNFSFRDVASYELPGPHDDLSTIIASFASRGFNERETVSLLGAHSTGTIHCKFILKRLRHFSGTDGPDEKFLNQLKSKCNPEKSPLSPSGPLGPVSSPSQAPVSSPSQAPVSSPLEGLKMDYEGPGFDFGTLYYRSLLQGKGLLHVDQQLTAGLETEMWVQAYASDVSLFQRDFTITMHKLSNYRVLTAPMGQVRVNCRRVAS